MKRSLAQRTDGAAAGSPPEGHGAVNDCWNRIGVRGDASCPELQLHVHCRNCQVFSAAAAFRLDVPVPADHLASWTRLVAQNAGSQVAGTESALVFRLGSEWLALPTTVVDEVAVHRPIHSLPHRRGGVIRGLANVRGELLICVSLAALMDLAGASGDVAPSAAKPRLLVIRHDDARVVAVVDEVDGIHRYHPSELLEPPAAVAKAGVTYARAVLPLRGKTAGLLDPTLLGQTLQRSLPSVSET